MKYRFIDREHKGADHPVWPVVVMCRVLSVHRSGYYAWRTRAQTGQLGKRAQENHSLSELIREIHGSSHQRYGAPRVTAELRRRGYRYSRGRVARLMQRHHLQSKRRRSYRITTRSNHALASPNLLDRMFTAEAVDRVWTSDITYISTGEGWLYLATVLDLYSRRIVGMAMGTELSKELVTEALEQAIRRRNPQRGLLLHSDRGSQYSSWSYRQLLSDHGFRQSMSRKGDCWDNAAMESFFKTLKVEEVYHRRYATRTEAEQSIFEYIEVYYNRQRLHSALGYETPEAFEANTKTANLGQAECLRK